MKTVTLVIGLLALVPALSFAQDRMERPQKGEFFDTILESVDQATADQLQASRDELGALHDEVKTLRGADVVDEEALQAAIENLHAERRGFREEVRTVIDSNEDLQLALEAARANSGFPGREGRRGPPRRFNRGEAQ